MCISLAYHLHIICTSLANMLHIMCTSFVHHLAMNMHIICTSLAHHLHIIWTSSGHHLGIIWGWFRNHLEMIQGSFRSHLGIMFGKIKVGGSGGRSPPVKQGVWGAARPPNTDQKSLSSTPAKHIFSHMADHAAYQDVYNTPRRCPTNRFLKGPAHFCLWRQTHRQFKSICHSNNWRLLMASTTMSEVELFLLELKKYYMEINIFPSSNAEGPSAPQIPLFNQVRHQFPWTWSPNDS